MGTGAENRITGAVASAQRDGRKMFVPYLTAGFPDRSRTVDLVLALEAGGADIVELGVPFSDPMADGPTVQHSCQVALDGGVTLAWIFDTVREIRRTSEIPLILFGYFNPVFRYGVARFMEDARQAGADGVLVADLPVGEVERIKPAARASGLRVICLAAPTCDDDQLRAVEAASDDFVYCVSVAGVTGVRASVYNTAEPFLRRVRAVISKPFVVGFGIATPDDVRQIGAISDGVVVGSALLRFLDSQANDDALPDKTRRFVEKLRAALP